MVVSRDNDCAGRWSTWGLYLKFLVENERILDDLTFATFDALDPTPDRYREPTPADCMIDREDYRDPALLV